MRAVATRILIGLIIHPGFSLLYAGVFPKLFVIVIDASVQDGDAEPGYAAGNIESYGQFLKLCYPFLGFLVTRRRSAKVCLI